MGGWRASALHPSPCRAQHALPLLTSSEKLMSASLTAASCVLSCLCNKQTTQKFWGQKADRANNPGTAPLSRPACGLTNVSVAAGVTAGPAAVRGRAAPPPSAQKEQPGVNPHTGPFLRPHWHRIQLPWDSTLPSRSRARRGGENETLAEPPSAQTETSTTTRKQWSEEKAHIAQKQDASDHRR